MNLLCRILLALLFLTTPAYAVEHPGGTSGQLQYNNSGYFGGFTLGGDCTWNSSTKNITCTKTNGNAFATSATTDTTNASNIGSGSLAYARLTALSANQVVGALTATTPSGLSVPSCSSTNNVLQWTAGTGFGCATITPGTGTVTTVSVTTANGVSGSVATATTTPAITLTLGAITPTSVNSVVISGSATPTLAVTGTTTVSGSNTGDQVVPANTTSTASNYFTAYNSTTGAFTKAQPACSDLSNGATGCSTATGTSGATIPLNNGSNTFSGSNTQSGAYAVTSTSTPTQAGGTLGLAGTATKPTLGANSEGDIFLTATGGFNIIGQGSTNDFTIFNKSGTSTCVVATGTTTLNCTGLQVGGVAVSTTTGTVTSIATTSPITGGTITSTGTIACATCATTTNGGALTATSPMAISSGGVISINAAVGGTYLGDSVATAQTIVLVQYAPYAMTINSLKNLGTVSGTVTGDLKINTTVVTGCSSLSLTSTPAASTSCTAANVVAAGDKISFVTSSPSSLTGLLAFSLIATRS